MRHVDLGSGPVWEEQTVGSSISDCFHDLHHYGQENRHLVSSRWRLRWPSQETLLRFVDLVRALHSKVAASLIQVETPNVWGLSSFHPNVSKQPPPPQCLGFVLFSPRRFYRAQLAATWTPRQQMTGRGSHVAAMSAQGSSSLFFLFFPLSSPRFLFLLPSLFFLLSSPRLLFFFSSPRLLFFFSSPRLLFFFSYPGLLLHQEDVPASIKTHGIPVPVVRLKPRNVSHETLGMEIPQKPKPEQLSLLSKSFKLSAVSQ